MTTEDLTIIEQAGRRCSGCRTGRNWRRFEVIRSEGRDPIVSCPACRSRFTATAPQPTSSGPRRSGGSSAHGSTGAAPVSQSAAPPASRTSNGTAPPSPDATAPSSASAAPEDTPASVSASPGSGAPSPGPSAPDAGAGRRSRPHRKPSASTSQPGDRLKRALRELPPGAHSTRRIARAAGLNERKVLPRLRALEAAGEVQRVGQLWSTEPPSTDLEAAFDRLEARTTNLRITRPRKRVG